MLTGIHIQRALRQNPPMTREEEQIVARAAQNGDRRARDRMVLCNLGLILKIAMKYTGTGVLHDDLVQYGVVGVLKAITKFDPERGTRFATYAAHWIAASIDDGAGVKEPMVRKRSQEARNMARGGTRVFIDSLNVPISDESDTTWLENIPSNDPPPDVQFFSAAKRAEVRWRLARLGLTDRERDIIHARMMGEERDPLSVVGARWGICRERIRQIEKALLPRLRRHFADLAA